MTPAQLRYVIGLRYELEKKEHGGDRKSSGQNDHLIERTGESLAEELGISPSAVQRNAAFARAVDVIAEKVGPTAKQAWGG